MLLVVEKGREEDIRRICDKWGVICAVIGRVTEDGRFASFTRESKVADIPVQTLADAPVYAREGKKPGYYREFAAFDPEPELSGIDPREALMQVLASPTVASKRWVYRQYDHMVRASTAVRPGSDAAVIVLRGTDKAWRCRTDGNGRYVYLDPERGRGDRRRRGGAQCGLLRAEPWESPTASTSATRKSRKFIWQLAEAIDGMAEACRVLGTPVIGGNVSLYNETEGQADSSHPRGRHGRADPEPSSTSPPRTSRRRAT